ncbi:hypothetical protein BD414DRAFT_517975 [Trametes punicea]|nr:hypothetical protein BD414DRAFT_517975 [Trametes punicea]
MSVNKIAAERNQRALLELVGQPGNDVCADCKSRNPRWASYNLGIFLCVSCASIHRKMGTHISKVKSLTLDSWTKEQVEFMRSMGNVKSNAHYNPDEIRNPPPTNMIESERDSELEKYIRAKYEYKSFVSRSAKVAALLGPSRSSSTRIASSADPPRSQTVPIGSSSATTSTASGGVQPSAPLSTSTTTATATKRTQSPIRSVSQPIAPASASPGHGGLTFSQPQAPFVQQQQQPQQSSNPIWNDLAQLQAPTTNSSFPLQYGSSTSAQPINITRVSTGLSVPNPYSGLSVSPNSPFPSSFSQPSSPGGAFLGGQPRSMSLNAGPAMGVNGMGFAPGTGPGMLGTSPSMLQPQGTLGGFPTAAAMLPQSTTPSPNPFTPQALSASGYGAQQQPQQAGTFGSSSLGQPSQTFLQPQGQAQPQGSPMFASQQLPYAQSSPMFQAGTATTPMQMQTQGSAAGNPFLQPLPQQQQPFGSPQPLFVGTPSPGPFGQNQAMYGQGSTGWQPQQWGGI